MRTLVLFAITALVSPACKEDRPAEPIARSEVAPPPATPAQASAPRAMEPSKHIEPLLQRLQWEAAHRPANGVKTEQVMEALGGAGIRLTEQRQYLGATMSASYCAGGVTAEAVAISVCEYATVDAALAGKRLMDERFGAATPHARRVARKNAVLTISHASAAGARGPEVQRAIDTFTRL